MKNKDTNTSPPPSPIKTESPSFSLYPNIHKLPLSVFVDVSVDEDLTLLCYEGIAPVDVLEAKWQEIVEAYAEAIGKGIQQTMRGTLQMEILRLRCKMENCRKMLLIMKDYYVKEFAEAVNEILSTSFCFDYADAADYDADIESANTRTKSFELKLSIKEDALQAIIDKEEKEGGKPTREYFDKILCSLSDWKEREITDEISVFKFCHYVKQFNDYAERQNRKQ